MNFQKPFFMNLPLPHLKERTDIAGKQFNRYSQ